MDINPMTTINQNHSTMQNDVGTSSTEAEETENDHGLDLGEATDQIEGDSDLDKDAFLELLVTQLQNQDPLDPMEDKEFISQMAQFSSLEQMQNMNQNLEDVLESDQMAEASALIDRNVEGIGVDGDNVSGVVETVVREEEEILLQLSDGEEEISEIKLEQVNIVS